MYEKIVLTTLLFVFAHSKEIPAGKNVQNANFPDSRISTIVPNLPLYDDPEDLAKIKAKRSSVFLAVPLQEIRDENRQLREAGRKTKRCDAALRKNRLPPSSVKRNADKNSHLGAPKRFSYILARSTTHPPPENSATTASWMKVQAADENRTLRRALENGLNTEDVTVNLDSAENAGEKKCNSGKYVCYCEKENCSRRSSKKTVSSPASAGSKSDRSRYQAPIERENAEPIYYSVADALRPEPLPRLYHAVISPESSVLGSINPIPMRSSQGRMSGALYAPLLRGIPIASYAIGNEKDAANVGVVPFAHVQDRPDFENVDENVRDRLRQAPRHDLRNYHYYPPDKGRFDAPSVGSTLSLTSDADDVTTDDDPAPCDPNGGAEAGKDEADSSAESSGIAGGFPSADEPAMPASYADGTVDRGSEDNAQLLRDLPSGKTGSKNAAAAAAAAAAVPPRLTATDYVDDSTAKPGTSSNSELYSSSGTIEKSSNETKKPSGLNAAAATPEMHRINTTTDSETKSTLNPHYPGTTVRGETRRKWSKTAPPRTTVPSRADRTDRPVLRSKTRSNLGSGDPRKNVEKSRSRGRTRELAAERIDRNDDSSSGSQPSFSEDYVDARSTTQPTDGEECMKLFGRDVCVLSATPPRMFADPAPGRAPNSGYSAIAIPLRVAPKSAEESTTLDDDPNYGVPRSAKCARDSEGSSAGANKNFEPPSAESTADKVTEPDRHRYSAAESTERIRGRDGDHGARSRSNESESDLVKDQQQRVLTKKPTNGMTEEAARNEQTLGKSKNRAAKVSLNPNAGADDSQTEPNFEESTSGNHTTIESTTEADYSQKDHPEDSRVREDQSTTARYVDLGKINDSDGNSEEDAGYTAESLGTTTEPSANELPFCDNSLLLNSINKVINNFALATGLTETEDPIESVLQMPGTSLLPEILKIQNLGGILSRPRIHETIVQKVIRVLSFLTRIPIKILSGGRSHGVIRNTLRNLLGGLGDSSNRPLPPMTVEEHQLKKGQWVTNLVTLAPVADSGSTVKLGSTDPGNLREIIGDLLNFPAIASQADRQIIQNMIVQSVKNSFADKMDELTSDDSPIYEALNDALRSLKSALGENDEIASADSAGNTSDSRDGYTRNEDYRDEEANVDDPMLAETTKFLLEEETIDETYTTGYREAKDDDPGTSIISESPEYSGGGITSGERNKNMYEGETSTLSTANKDVNKVKGNIAEQIYDGVGEGDAERNEDAKPDELTETEVTYPNAAVPRRNFNISATAVPSDSAKPKKLHGNEGTNILLGVAAATSPTAATGFREEEGRRESENGGGIGNESMDRNSRINNRILGHAEYHRTDDDSEVIGAEAAANTTRKSSTDYVESSEDGVTSSEGTAGAESIEHEAKYAGTSNVGHESRKGDGDLLREQQPTSTSEDTSQVTAETQRHRAPTIGFEDGPFDPENDPHASSPTSRETVSFADSRKINSDVNENGSTFDRKVDEAETAVTGVNGEIISATELSLPDDSRSPRLSSASTEGSKPKVTRNEETQEETTIFADNNPAETTMSIERSYLPTGGASYGTPNPEGSVIAKIKDAIAENEEVSSISQAAKAANTPPRSLDTAFLGESSETSTSQREVASTTEVCDREYTIATINEIATDYDTTETVGYADFAPTTPFADRIEFDRVLAAAPSPTVVSESSRYNETVTDTTDLIDENHSDEREVGMVKHDATADSTEGYSSEQDDADMALALAKIEVGAPFDVKYYTREDRIMDYIKRHRVDSANAKIADGTQVGDENFTRKTPSDYAQPSDGVVTSKGRKAESPVGYQTVRETSSANATYENREEEIISASATDGDLSGERQPAYDTPDVSRIREVAAEIRRADGATDFKDGASNLENRPNATVCEVRNCTNNGRGNNGIDGALDGSIPDNVSAKGSREEIVSATKSSANDSYSLQIFPSSEGASEEDILQLQKSKLFYVNDDVRLPLEIRRLTNGTYALSISKNICEYIMRRKCPCCVPLDGHVVQLSRNENARENDAERDGQSAERRTQSPTTTESGQSRKSEEEEKITSARHPDDRRKRDLKLTQEPVTFSMPVLDFARKYNLSLDFDEKMLSNGVDSRDKIANYDESLTKSLERDQSRDKNLDDNVKARGNILSVQKENEIAETRDLNVTEKKDISKTNIGNLTEIESHGARAKANQFRTSEKLKLYKLETDQSTESEDQTSRPVSKKIKIFKGETKKKSEETERDIKAGNVKLPKKDRRQKKLVKHDDDEENDGRADDNGQNFSKIKRLGRKGGRPYRYQRNAGNFNNGVEIVKNMLYWLKDVFTDG